MSILINADDFGKSEDVSRAILECFEKKIIDRTTLMVNMPYADEAVELAKQNGYADKVGIHLNLTEGMPLTEGIKQNPLLCGPDGRFHALFCHSLKYRLYMDNLSRQQIYEELKAQLDKYAEYGLTLYHVDSHHHVHTDYPIFLVLKSLARDYKFSSIRLGRNLYRGGNPLMKVYKILYNGSVRKLCNNVTDLFGSYKDFKNFGTDSDLRKLVKDKAVEIMIHPMYKDGVLTDTDTPMSEVCDTLSRIKQK